MSVEVTMLGDARTRRSSIGMFLAAASITAALMACNLAYPVGGGPTTAMASGGTGGIAGRVWHDVCAAPGEGQPTPANPPRGCQRSLGGALRANGMLDPGEGGLAGIIVRLGEGACPSFGLSEARTDAEGLFIFAGLAPGTYCASIDPGETANADLLQPGWWTYPSIADPEGPALVQVSLGEGELRTDLYFAWDFEFKPAYEPPATATPTPSPSDTATPTISPEPTSTPTLTPTAAMTPTPTLGAGDPRQGLGQPTWVDIFEDGNEWPLYEDPHARFEVGEDGLVMTAFNPDFYNSWILNWRKSDNLYLEATGRMGACGGRDSFGLMFRASRSEQGYVGYLFGVSCDGRYSLRAWDGESMNMITAWTRHPSLPDGGNAERRIGVRADRATIRLYGQGELLTEVTDGRHDAGLFGLYVSAAETANFTVTVRELAYWDLP